MVNLVYGRLLGSKYFLQLLTGDWGVLTDTGQ